MQKTLLFLSLIVACAVLAMPANAWLCAGHMITARVAELLLPKEVNQYFDTIASYHENHYPKITSKTELACWADDIKAYMPSQYNSWHFDNQCYNPGEQVPCPTTKASASKPNIKIALTRAMESIVAVNATLEDRSFWLAFIIHLVGDFHQPLHTTSMFDARFPRGDLGGNLFKIQFQGNETELHLWHDEVGGLIPPAFPSRPLKEYPSGESELDAMAKQLLVSQPNPGIAVTNNTDLDVWLQEGFKIATQDSYQNGTLIFNAPLTPQYVEEMRSILVGRLALGGRRLSNVLWNLYDTMQSRGIVDPTV